VRYGCVGVGVRATDEDGGEDGEGEAAKAGGRWNSFWDGDKAGSWKTAEKALKTP
jgi:hypothetical protein